MTSLVPELTMVSGILWSRIYLLMGDHLATNHEDVVMLRKHLTDVTHQLYIDIIDDGTRKSIQDGRRNLASFNTQNQGQCTSQRATVPTLTTLQSNTAVHEELKPLKASPEHEKLTTEKEYYDQYVYQ